MSAIKTYFVREVNKRMLTLEHHSPTDFYLSAWQTTQSVVPLLILRLMLFLMSVAIEGTSVTTYILSGKFFYWFIYLTHWCWMSIILTTGFATLVSARCYLYGPISAESKLPWYLKTYWTLFNISAPFTFMTSIIFWTAVFTGIEKISINGMDVAVHGLNSFVMLVVLFSDAHPVRLLHIYQPLVAGFIYVLFSIIYHFAGGKDPKGEDYIYAPMNWSNPVTAILAVLFITLVLTILFLLTLGLSLVRNACAAHWLRGPAECDEALPLPQSTTAA